MAEAKRDDNRVPGLVATNAADTTLPVIIWADATTHRLYTNSVVSSSALPTGAATEATLSSIDTALSGLTYEGDALKTTATLSGDINVGDVGILNSGDVQINPATEDKQDDAIALLTTIDADTSDIKTAVEVIDDIVQTEDAAHSSGHKGVMLLGVRQDDATTLANADGDYTPLSVSDHGCLNVDPQHFLELDDCNATTGWSVINNDTDNLTTSKNHVVGTDALSFDKVDGAGNTVFAGIQKTVTSTSINKFIEEGGGFFLCSMYLSDISDVAYLWFRAGTDSSNYAEWRVADTDIAAARWNALRGVMRAPYTSAGNGINTAAVTYIAIGVAFDNQANTLAGILVDGLFANSGLQTSADITSQVSTSVSSPNVRIVGYGGTVSTGAGNSGVGTLRVTNATDDVNLAAIKTAVELIDNTVSGSELQVDIVSSALPTGAATAANQTTIIGHVDGIEALLTTIDADTSTIAGDTTSIDGKITACNTGDVTIGAAIPAGSNTIGNVKITDGTDVADVIDSGTYAGIGAYILDGSGDPITAFGGGVQYTEGDTDETITGTVVMWEDGSDTLVAASAAKPLPVDVSISSVTITDIEDGASDSIMDAANNAMQTSVVVALPAGDNNIGNVDIASSVALDVSAATVTVDATGQGDVPITLDGETVTVDLGANNDVTLAVLPDTAAGDLAAQTTDLAAIEVLLGTIDADTSTIAGDTTSIDGKITACDTTGLATEATVATLLTEADFDAKWAAGLTVDLGANNDVTLAVLPDTAAGDLATLAAVDYATSAKQDTIIGHVDGIEALLGTIDADTSNMATSLGNIDNAVDGNYLNVNMNYAGTDASVGAGTEAAALRVTVANDSTGVLSVDDNGGSLTVDAVTPSNNTVSAYAASLVIKGSAGTLFGLSGYNSKTSTQFIQLHDASSLPADTAVPKVVIAVPASANFSIDFGLKGRAFATGITVCNSSTGATKTIGSADCWFDAQYV